MPKKAILDQLYSGLQNQAKTVQLKEKKILFVCLFVLSARREGGEGIGFRPESGPHLFCQHSIGQNEVTWPTSHMIT